MKIIKIWFTDFFEGFEPGNNYFYSLLSESYSVRLTPENPDYLIYSCYGSNFLKYDCIRIFYTGENLVPDFNLCDYAIGFHKLNFSDRYIRYPNFAFIENQFAQLTGIDPKFKNTKEYFCNFIYANAEANPIRDQFFQELSKYKMVNSPGSHLNNTRFDIGGRFSKNWMYSKLDFQSKCKFTIAFENSSTPDIPRKNYACFYFQHHSDLLGKPRNT